MEAKECQRLSSSSSVWPTSHCNWSNREREQLEQWCDRREALGRPRTYDKYYQKTPGNFHLAEEKPSGDSAISAGSSGEEQQVLHTPERRVRDMRGNCASTYLPIISIPNIS